MPRPKSSVPGYCRHRQSGRAYVTLSGQQKLLPGPFNSPESRGAYDRLIAEYLNAGRTLPPEPDAAASPTVSTVISAFWKHAQTYYLTPAGGPSSEQENLRQALVPLRRLYGPTAAAAFGPRALASLQQEMVRLGWCRTHINRQTARLKHVFKWAVAAELVPPAVHQGLAAVPGLRKGKSAARESDPVKPVPDDRVEATLPHVAPQVAAMVRLQLLTGMRPGELVIMRGCDLETADPVWTYRPAHHKTEHHGHAREIRIGPKAQEYLRPFLKPDLGAYLFSPADAERARRERRHAARRTPMNFGNRPGTNCGRAGGRRPATRYTVNSYRRAIARGCDAAFPPPQPLAGGRVKGAKANALRAETPAEWRERIGEEKWAEVLAWREAHRWHPHQLRHNAATRLRREFGIEAARVILGHRSAAVTHIYAEADVQKATRIMAEVG